MEHFFQYMGVLFTIILVILLAMAATGKAKVIVKKDEK